MEQGVRILLGYIDPLACAPDVAAQMRDILLASAGATVRETFAKLKQTVLESTWAVLEPMVEEAMVLEFDNLAVADVLPKPPESWSSETIAEWLERFEKQDRARAYEEAFANFRLLRDAKKKGKGSRCF